MYKKEIDLYNECITCLTNVISLYEKCVNCLDLSIKYYEEKNYSLSTFYKNAGVGFKNKADTLIMEVLKNEKVY